ncbi:hypothetical protein ACXYTJ_04505 [Gilvimarinus sp. F26214L]|uniref:hypothetical protein n=1 Tax=Gilvimarinus sp. DZF01 TaxID=3461371 RepID=UPI0040464834
MKLLNILLLTTLTACGHVSESTGPDAAPDGTVRELPPGTTDEDKPEPPDEVDDSVISDATTEEPEELEENYLPVSDWLMQRKSVCEEDPQTIDLQLERYVASMDEPIPEDGDDELVQAYSRLKALMLASCDPARTPGLIGRFLQSMRRYSHWPPEYEGLFDLLEEQYRAYVLLDDRYRELETRHQKTIEGIGNIERSLESPPDPGE